MTVFLRLLILGTFLFAALAGFAAPHPLTGSSMINNPQNALAFAQMGFTIGDVPANWAYTKSFDSDANVIEIGQNQKSLLTFRLENVSAQAHLENYVRQFLRDYNQYGFEVGQLQSKNQGNLVVVDLNQKNKATRSRQVFFKKENHVIIATCNDTTARFDQTLLICNQILNQFQWK